MEVSFFQWVAIGAPWAVWLLLLVRAVATRDTHRVDTLLLHGLAAMMVVGLFVFAIDSLVIRIVAEVMEVMP